MTSVWQGNVWLNPQDTIRIGPYKLVMGEDQFTRYDETEGLRVEAYHLNKWVRKDLNLLQDISLVFQPREFIVVVGQSGGGKSTLVDAIAGYRPATQGKVSSTASMSIRTSMPSATISATCRKKTSSTWS